MLNKICKEAWETIATSFKETVADDDDSEVAGNATVVAKSKFSERLYPPLPKNPAVDIGENFNELPQERTAGKAASVTKTPTARQRRSCKTLRRNWWRRWITGGGLPVN
jgi:hypothetical protein